MTWEHRYREQARKANEASLQAALRGDSTYAQFLRDAASTYAMLADRANVPPLRVIYPEDA